ncbi:unnamed protein product [Adineta ricciae]|uniref:Uncharacterized protein n=1 Tax=Adineta ricciae TaxID=249248 RepID=A0A815ZFM1_ADIRI|nr:unnamed protein product [Adineta ricciae]
MQLFLPVLITIFLTFFPLATFGFFFRKSESKEEAKPSKECCVLPKVNVDWRKANLGRDFFRQLTVNSDASEETTYDDMCSLIHFLFQQASMNKKPVTVVDELFILHDATNLVFNRLIQSRNIEQYKTNSYGRRFLKLINPFQRLGRNTHVMNNSVNSYATHGMDIPGSCLPNGFDRVILGELPPIPGAYEGQRIFIKTDRSLLKNLEINSMMDNAKTFTKQRFCRFVRGESKSECVKIRAFAKNSDKKVLIKWIKTLSKLPSKLQLNRQYRKLAVMHGIYEIYQQAKKLEAAGAKSDVKKFRKSLTEKYGEDHIRLRQGQEIIFTTAELKSSHLTCESKKDKRCKK